MKSKILNSAYIQVVPGNLIKREKHREIYNSLIQMLKENKSEEEIMKNLNMKRAKLRSLIHEVKKKGLKELPALYNPPEDTVTIKNKYVKQKKTAGKIPPGFEPRGKAVQAYIQKWSNFFKENFEPQKNVKSEIIDVKPRKPLKPKIKRIPLPEPISQEFKFRPTGIQTEEYVQKFASLFKKM